MSTSLTRTEKKVLRTLVPLSTLPDEQFEELCSTCRVHNGTPGTLLFQQGDRSSSFYYLLSGKISFSIGDIQVETIEFGSPPARFALAHQLPRKVTATALTTIRFIRLECEELEVSGHEQHLSSSYPAKAATEIASITELVLSDQGQSSESLGEPQICETEPSAGKGFFKWFKTVFFHPGSIKSAPSESSLSGNTADENSSTQSKTQQTTEFQQSVLPSGNSPALPQNGGQDSLQERGWKQSLPEETENQLKAVILPLMQEIPGICGSIVATEKGSFVSPQFPKHRIERIKAIVQTAKNGVHDDDPEFPEEILLREKGSQILIFLIGSGGLLALHANITANLGLIRLEAYPIVIQIREIISLQSKFAAVPSLP